MRNLSRRQLIILLVVIAALIGLIVVVTIFSNRRSADYVKVTKDKDTGETIYTEPNKTPEKDQAGNSPFLLGTQPLLDNGMTQDQFIFCKTALLNYSSKNLGDKYDRLKILPDGLKSTGTETTAKLRLGDDGPTVNVVFKYSELRYAQVIITDPTGTNGGNFDSGPFDALSTQNPKYQNVQELPD